MLVVPNVLLPLFGLPETTEVWVRVVGMPVLILDLYYCGAARRLPGRDNASIRHRTSGHLLDSVCVSGM